MSDKSWLEKCKNYLKYSAMDAKGNRVVIVHEEDFRKLLVRVMELEAKLK